MKTTDSTRGPICPYCSHERNADEDFFFDQERFTEMECERCERLFDVTVEHTTNWSCSTREKLELGEEDQE